MPAPDLDTAQQFQSAAEDALRTGDFEPLVAFLAEDVELVMPVHTLRGVDALTEELSRARPGESFDLEFESGEWEHRGNGRLFCEIRVLYVSKVADNLSYSRDRSFELTISEGKVSRFEMRFDG
jgi:hypothetical protein